MDGWIIMIIIIISKGGEKRELVMIGKNYYMNRS